MLLLRLILFAGISLHPMFPQQLKSIYNYTSPSGNLGYAFVVGNRVYTAAHLAEEGPGTIETIEGIQAEYNLRLLLSIDHKLDIATLLAPSSEDALSRLSISKIPPMIGSPVFYACKIPVDSGGWAPIFLTGTIAGFIDDDKKLVISGFTAPGCSGGPVLTRMGEVVGLVNGATVWLNTSVPDPSRPQTAMPIIYAVRIFGK